MGRSLILLPSGPPEDRGDADEWSTFAFHAGGDMGRVFDETFGTLEEFASHISRLTSWNEPPVVVLTRVIPVEQRVLDLRRELSRRVPALRKASWLLYVPRRDRALFDLEARVGGTFEAPGDENAIWIFQAMPFLICTGTMGDKSAFVKRCERLRSLASSLGLPSTAPRGLKTPAR